MYYLIEKNYLIIIKFFDEQFKIESIKIKEVIEEMLVIII